MILIGSFFGNFFVGRVFCHRYIFAVRGAPNHRLFALGDATPLEATDNAGIAFSNRFLSHRRRSFACHYKYYLLDVTQQTNQQQQQHLS
jgi:hypothetical protein